MNDLQKTVLATGLTLMAGFLTRSILKASWRTVKHQDPPVDPSSRQTSWGDALLWTTVTALAAGLSRLLVRRGVNEVFAVDEDQNLA